MLCPDSSIGDIIAHHHPGLQPFPWSAPCTPTRPLSRIPCVSREMGTGSEMGAYMSACIEHSSSASSVLWVANVAFLWHKRTVALSAPAPSPPTPRPRPHARANLCQMLTLPPSLSPATPCTNKPLSATSLTLCPTLPAHSSQCTSPCAPCHCSQASLLRGGTLSAHVGQAKGRGGGELQATVRVTPASPGKVCAWMHACCPAPHSPPAACHGQACTA